MILRGLRKVNSPLCTDAPPKHQTIRTKLLLAASSRLANIFFRLRNGSGKIVLGEGWLVPSFDDTLCAGVRREG